MAFIVAPHSADDRMMLCSFGPNADITLAYITLKICSARLTKMSSRSLHRPMKVDNNE